MYLGRFEALRPTNECDALVMESNQVLDRLTNAPGIVHSNVAEFLPRSPGIKRDDGYTGALHLFDQPLFHFRSHDRDALNLAVEKAMDTQFGAFRTVLGISDYNFIVALDRDVLEGLDKVGKERISNVGDDESENMALAGAQRARMRIRVVIQIPDRSPDFRGRSRCHGVGTVDGAGHGCRRDLRFGGHLPDVHGQKHTTFQPDPLAARNPPRKVQSLIISLYPWKRELCSRFGVGIKGEALV